MYYSIAPILAIISMLLVLDYQMRYKRYINTCENLQIDPSKLLTDEEVAQRVDTVLAQWSEADGDQFVKLNKNLAWFKKRYHSLVGLNFFTGDRFVKRSEKDLAKGRMTLHEGTVSEEYIKKPLSSTNYDARKWYHK